MNSLLLIFSTSIFIDLIVIQNLDIGINNQQYLSYVYRNIPSAFHQTTAEPLNSHHPNIVGPRLLVRLVYSNVTISIDHLTKTKSPFQLYLQEIFNIPPPFYFTFVLHDPFYYRFLFLGVFILGFATIHQLRFRKLPVNIPPNKQLRGVQGQKVQAEAKRC